MVEDITDRKRAALESQHYAGQLKRANDDLLHFAYAVTHDLHAPLRTATAFSQLLIRKCADKLAPEGKELLRTVVDATSRMSTLIQDLLEFAKVAGQEVESQAVALEEALASALKNLSSDINDARATITHVSLPVVRGSAVQMVQVFQNLISNAIKYQRPNVPPTIHIAAVIHNREAVVSVFDNGLGFAQEDADKVFGVFQRLHTGLSGTGIGLTICKRIIENAGGRIWATSKVGEGATFSFSLPLAGAALGLPSGGPQRP